MKKEPYSITKVVAVPGCVVGEDVVFSDDGKFWYLSCMGAQAMIVGDATKDEPIKTIKVAAPYPHGIAIHNGIDRILLSSTVRASDLGDAGENISAVEASSGKVLGTYKVSNKPSPAGNAPVEILFVPGANPPVAYITNMYGGTLWTATWNPAKKDFDVQQVHDFAAQSAGVPLEMYFNKKADRLYVTTAKPGHMHIFDLSAGPGKPRLLKSIATAEGAHHVAFTQDGRYAYVQNTLLNLPGMTRAKNHLHLLVPQRFYTHQQSRSGDRHVYAALSRFLPECLLHTFECCAWPVVNQANEPPARAPQASIAKVDISARARAQWR